MTLGGEGTWRMGLHGREHRASHTVTSQPLYTYVTSSHPFSEDTDEADLTLYVRSCQFLSQGFSCLFVVLAHFTVFASLGCVHVGHWVPSRAQPQMLSSRGGALTSLWAQCLAGSGELVTGLLVHAFCPLPCYLWASVRLPLHHAQPSTGRSLSVDQLPRLGLCSPPKAAGPSCSHSHGGTWPLCPHACGGQHLCSGPSSSVDSPFSPTGIAIPPGFLEILFLAVCSSMDLFCHQFVLIISNIM